MEIEVIPEKLNKKRLIAGWVISVSEHEPEYDYILDNKYELLMGYDSDERGGVKYRQIVMGFDLRKEQEPEPLPIDDEDFEDVYEECLTECLENKLYDARMELKMAHATIKGLNEDMNECTENLFFLRTENEKLKARIAELQTDDE